MDPFVPKDPLPYSDFVHTAVYLPMNESALMYEADNSITIQESDNETIPLFF